MYILYIILLQLYIMYIIPLHYMLVAQIVHKQCTCYVFNICWLLQFYITSVHVSPSLYAGCFRCTYSVYMIPFHYMLVVHSSCTLYLFIKCWFFQFYIARVHYSSSLYILVTLFVHNQCTSNAEFYSCTQIVYMLPLHYMLVALVVHNSCTCYLFIISWLFKLYIAGVR